MVTCRIQVKQVLHCRYITCTVFGVPSLSSLISLSWLDKSLVPPPSLFQLGEAWQTRSKVAKIQKAEDSVEADLELD